MSERSGVVWRKSSWSVSGECVEVAMANSGTADKESDDAVFLIRDSKDPTGGILRLTSDAWAAFVTDIKEGSNL